MRSVSASRLTSAIEAAGLHGYLWGSGWPFKLPDNVTLGSVEEALPAVRRYVDDPVAPRGWTDGDRDRTFREMFAENWADGDRDLTFREMFADSLDSRSGALALVAGARRLTEDARAIELAAAQVARSLGVTIRELAQAADISERAASDRYRRD